MLKLINAIIRIAVALESINDTLGEIQKELCALRENGITTWAGEI